LEIIMDSFVIALIVLVVVLGPVLMATGKPRR
jgi:hypothetical protein